MKNSIEIDLSALQSTDLDAGQVFSGKPSGTTVSGYAAASAYTPAIDPDYIFHESSRDIVVWFVASAIGEPASRTDASSVVTHETTPEDSMYHDTACPAQLLSPSVPEEKAGEIVQELLSIRSDFQKEKEAFLASYDQNVQAWIEKHHQWSEIIRNSTVGPDYVRGRMDFRWQLYKVAPLEQHEDNTAVLEAGLAEEVQGLGGTLFGEVAKSAEDIWRRVYHGKMEVTHKALSPLRTLHAKLTGLSFVEPHVAPVADIVQAGLLRMPKKGNITGPDLLLLQGLVCLLKDSTALVGHAQKIIEGYGPAFVLDALLAGPGDTSNMQVHNTAGEESVEEPILLDISMPDHALPHPVIPSLGLW